MFIRPIIKIEMKDAQPKKRTELQRLLSKRGFSSRSKAAALILKGEVRVNGKVIKDPLAYVSIDSELFVSGMQISAQNPAEKVIIAFHKPRGVVTTSSDEKGRKTVYDSLPEEYRHLKAVGRLDLATSGLLLFTNDNKLADWLLDPKNKVPRTYVATVKGEVLQSKVDALKSGIKDGEEVLRAEEVMIRKASGRESTLIITLVEGKNREIRRMGESIGHEIIKLKRISFGDIILGDLEVGKVKEIKESKLLEEAETKYKI